MLGASEVEMHVLRGFGVVLDGCGDEGVCKSARFAILNGRGEMAERLKATVC